ncbi:hypothetical protein GCM10018792_71880 [Streptomyces rubradiris]|nr:hypothetical protein GCM10018792_71880 [Streptomyces rubradiris]
MVAEAVPGEHRHEAGLGPAWPTVYRRFAQGSRERVWAGLHRVILDGLGARGEWDWSRCAIGVRAAEGGP